MNSSYQSIDSRVDKEARQRKTPGRWGVFLCRVRYARIDILSCTANAKPGVASVRKSFIASGLCALIFVLHATCVSASETAVDFTHEIQPLLKAHCLECHGAEKKKGGFRMDLRTGFFREGDSGKLPLVPGHSKDSQFIQRVQAADNDDDRMPPKGERLKPEQIALLKTWIDAGALIPEDASSQKHWAYIKPVMHPLPDVKNKTWGRNGIDNFVMARLEKEGLSPSAEADKAVLLRRVSLDLCGLPPTLEETDAFLADKSPDAYEKAVDRLLASPAYGERWARPWLDLARYADTQGYEKDNRRSLWPFRDWVINSLNQDMPFDEFTIEQLAGDLLPNATQQQQVATGFHRNTMTNTEGGVDPEEFRYEALVDRVSTTFGVWMGTTLNCAQCHNHKYDPLTTVEYYRMMAFFNNTADVNNENESPTIKVLQPGQKEQLESKRDVERAAAKKLDEAAGTPEMLIVQAEWEPKAAVPVKWETLDPIEIKSEAGATLTKAADGSVLVGGANPDRDTFVVTVKTKIKGINQVRLEVLPDQSLPGNGPGRSENGNIILSEFKIAADGKPVALKSAVADFEQDGWPVAGALDGKPETGWALSGATGQPHSAIFTSAVPFGAGVGDGNETTLIFRLECQSPQWARHVLGKFRLSATTSPEITTTKKGPEKIPDDVRAALALAQDKRSDKQRARLHDYFRDTSPALKTQRDALASTKKAADDFEKTIPITSVLQELSKPREMRRHVRGAYLSTAEVLTPGTPAALHPFPKDQPVNRLGLARWIADKENPLTARVLVNRYWEQFFGKGIVETVEEFGKQGDPPSHPEMFDWLALQFVNGAQSPNLSEKSPKIAPWGVKALHRLIVTSAAYRQTSKVPPDLRDRDPYNRLLARGPRVRLEAEMVRDQALSVSGLLSHKLGGPSVMPPQPGGIWQIVYSGDQWQTSKGEDKYRRGLYTFWRRSSPNPMMSTFDAPSREFCVVRRSRSNTPLQALNTLNDPVFVEAAQALARKIAAVPGDAKTRVAFAMRTCLSRAPKADEVERLAKLFEGELAYYSKQPGDAEKMATSELGKPAPGNGMNIPELAAWTVVSNVLLNLDEMITKG